MACNTFAVLKSENGISTDIHIGDVLDVKVVKITDFGAFVESDDGQGGLIHISEIDHSFVKDVRDFLAEGQSIEAKVIELKDDGKMTFSIKRLTEPTQERKPYRRRANPEFEKMLKTYMKSSEQTLADANKKKKSAKRKKTS